MYNFATSTQNPPPSARKNSSWSAKFGPHRCAVWKKNGAPSEATAVIESQGSASERPASSWQKKMNPGTKLTFSDLGLVKWLATGGKNWLNNGFSPSCQLVS